MAELILADAGEGQIFLEGRSDANPLGVLLAHEMLVIGEGQNHINGGRVGISRSSHSGTSSASPGPSRMNLRRAATAAPS